MPLLISSQKVHHPPRDPSNTPQTRSEWQDGPSNPSKMYHATGAWGKRGMTLLELTRAFDAFNENEERVAIGFASSEDCAKKLAEPLSSVKTVFSDLDGLKRPRGYSSPPTSPSVLSSSRKSSSHTLRVRSSVDSMATNEFGFLVQTPCAVNATGTDGTHQSGTELADGVDEDTIKPLHKRRRSLSAISPLELEPAVQCELTSSIADDLEPCVLERPPRPSSRLGFIGGILDEDEDEDEDVGR